MLLVGLFIFGADNIQAAYITNGNSQWINNESSIYYNLGNIGIGTTSPSNKLHIYGGASGGTPYEAANGSLVLERNGRTSMQFLSPSTNDQYIFFGDPQSANRAWLGYDHNIDQLLLHTGSTIYMDGNVGISTTAPGAKLDIFGSVTAMGLNIRSTTGQIQFYPYTTTANYIESVDGTGTSSRLLYFTGYSGTSGTFAFSGNVGIGNTNPGTMLTMATSTGSVINTAGGQIIGLPSVQTQDNQAVSRKYLHDNFSSTSSIASSSFWTGSLLGNISNLNTANVGIGLTNPAAKLDVNGTAKFGGIFFNDSIKNDDSIYFSPQSYIEKSVLPPFFNVNNPGVISFVTDVSTAIPFGTAMLFSGYSEGQISDFIPVQAGENLYTEVWVKTGAGTPGPFYIGVSQYDKDKKVINSNSGLQYFTSITIPANTGWQKISGSYTLPLTHTPFNGSDGGAVRYVKYYIIVDYSGGTTPLYLGGLILRRTSVFRDSGNSIFNGNVGIGTTTPNEKLTIQTVASGGEQTALSLRHALNGAGDNVAIKFWPAGAYSGITLPGKIVATAPNGNNIGFNFVTNNSGVANTAFSILPSGNVGIGTTNPDNIFSITKNSTAGSETANAISILSVAAETKLIMGAISGSYSYIQSMQNGTGWTQRPLVLQGQGGNVGIGNTSPDTRLTMATSTGSIISTAGGQIIGLPAVQTQDTQAVSRKYLHDNFSSTSSIAAVSFWAGSLTGNISNANTGNVGIGTTIPRATLNVATTTGGSTLNSVMRVQSMGSGTGSGPSVDFVNIWSGAGGWDNWIQGRVGSVYDSSTSNGGALVFYTNNSGSVSSPPTEKVRINPAGYLGIGTTNPASVLHLYGASGATTEYLKFTSVDGGDIRFGKESGVNNNAILGTWTNNDLVFYTNTGERMRILSGGNVGIGTTNPDTKLQIQGALKLQNLASSSPDTNFRRIINVVSYQGGGVDRTGILVIKLPTPLAHSMGKINISGWSYGKAWDLSVSAYMYPGSGWTSLGGTVVTGNPPFNLSDIRLVADTTANTFYILLGSATTNYGYYASVGVDVDSYYSNNLPSTGWDIYIAASNPTFNVSATPAVSLYGSSNALISGNAGIGTTTPALKLVVSNGTGNVINSAGGQVNGLPAVQTQDDQAISRKYLHDNFSSTSSSLWTGSLVGNISNANTGNVGIGTTTPSQKLTIFGGNALGQIRMGYSNDSSWSIGRDNMVTGDFVFVDGPSAERMRITHSGNVGVGTTNPNFKSTVYSATGNYFATALQSGAIGTPGNWVGQLYGFGASAGYNKGATIFESIDGNGRGKFHIALNDSANSSDVTLADTRLTVLSGGNVGIGTTSPTTLLSLYSTSGAMAGGIRIQGNIAPDVSNIWTQDIYSKWLHTESAADAAAGYGRIDFETNAAYNLTYPTRGGFSFKTTGAGQFVTFTNTGNVGIGTTTPALKLVVSNGTGNVINSAGGQINGLPAVQTEDTQAVSRKYLHDNFSSSSTASTTSLWGGAKNGNIWNGDAGVGNVGIGTTNPASLGVGYSPVLDISGTAPALTFHDTTASAKNYQFGVNSDTLYIRDDNDIRMAFNQGNVGIGTTNPGEKLDVAGSAKLGATNKLYFNTAVTYLGSDVVNELTAQGYSKLTLSTFNDTSGEKAIVFSPKQTERMRIDSLGNVGVGTTAPGAKLDVVNITSLGRIRVSGASTGYTQADLLLQTGTTDGPAGRGTGIYTQNQGSNTTWYVGNPYGASDSFVINRKTGTAGLLVETADVSGASVSNFLTIKNSGNIGIGTSTVTAAKLVVSGGTGNIISTLGGQILGLPAVQTEDNQAVSRKYLHDNFLTAASSTGASLWAGVKNGDIWNGDAGVGRVGIGTNRPITQLHVAGFDSFIATGVERTDSISRDVYVQNDLAYVAIVSGLQIFDVSKDVPVLLGNASGSAAHSVYVQGIYAYLANNDNNSVQIADVSDSNNPTIISSLAVGSTPYDIYVQGNYAYVVTRGGNSLEIIDISNILAPTVVGSVSLTDPTSVYVQGRYAYVTSTSEKKLYIVNIFNVTSPSVVGMTSTDGDPISVYVQGRYAYVACSGDSTLNVFDINIATNPVLYGQISVANKPLSVYAQGNYVYVASQGSTIVQSINISDPRRLTIAGAYDIGDNLNSIFVQGRYAYATSESDMLHKIDLGGAYIQQLEAGGIETGTLSTRNNLQVGNDLDVRGGATIGAGGIFNAGNLSIWGSSFLQGNVGIGINSNLTSKLMVNDGSGNVINSGGGQINGLPAVQTEDDQAISRKYLHDNFSTAASSLWGGTKNGNIWNGDSGVGNIGIGTTNPTVKLEIVGNQIINGGFYAFGGSGDVNLSSTITGADSAILEAYLRELTTLTTDKLINADVNGDGLVNGTDYHFLRSLVNFSIPLSTTRRYAGYGLTVNPVDTAGNIAFSYQIGRIATSSTSTAMNIVGSNVGVGTTTPAATFAVNGSALITSSLDMKGNINMGSQNITAVNKLTVNTIDPLYNIKGWNYSTFASSIVGGVKEEYVGKIKISRKVSVDNVKEYEAAIDFTKLKEGSDLWVWHKIIDFNTDNVQVLLTPYGSFANLYYKIENNRLIFRSDRPVEVSYRLVGKRFDWRQWPTKALDQSEKAGFILK